MKRNLNILILVSLVTLIFLSCKKNGTGGDNTIAAFPKHHDKSIPGAIVYIKYGSKEFPGEDASLYDDKKIAPYSGSEAAHAHFEGLLKGDYYLYSVGYDSAISAPVKGGISIRITSKKGETEVDVPITE